MSRGTRPRTLARTGQLPAVTDAGCGCASADLHRWSAPVVKTVNTVVLTRWRCTCHHCHCDGLHLVVDPIDVGSPQDNHWSGCVPVQW